MNVSKKAFCIFAEIRNVYAKVDKLDIENVSHEFGPED